MGSSYGTINVKDVKKEDIEKFKNWLSGKKIKNSCISWNSHSNGELPHLSEEQISMIINHLQNELHVLPQSDDDDYEYSIGSLSEKTVEFAEYLLVYKMNIPAMTAFHILYYLQEMTGFEILPDNVEICKKCHGFFCLDDEGGVISDEYRKEDGTPFSDDEKGCYCDYCLPAGKWD